MLGMSSKLKAIMSQAAAGLRPQDVFATSLYAGTYSDQTITNGINLSGEGGAVWIKSRLYSGAPRLFDTVRGGSYQLVTSTAGASVDLGSSMGVTQFRNNGFTLAGSGGGYNDSTGEIYASWTFRRAPKFFDVVTYTGNGTAGRAISHNLGVTPGMVIVKRLDFSTGWTVWHRSASGTLYLHQTAAQDGSHSMITEASSTTFTVSNNACVNNSGSTEVAYLFAHDADSSGVVQCGSFVADGTGADTSVNLGWRPQFVLLKVSSTSSDWAILDTTRGYGSGNDRVLYANLSNAENATSEIGTTTSTGFTMSANLFGRIGATHVYLAIREPT